jgi:hypothetical protein
MRNKFLAVIAAILLGISPVLCGQAEEAQPVLPTIDAVIMEQDGNRLAYPQIAAGVPADIQQKINDDIILSADIVSHMITFASLTPDSLWGLQVSYES